MILLILVCFTNSHAQKKKQFWIKNFNHYVNQNNQNTKQGIQLVVSRRNKRNSRILVSNKGIDKYLNIASISKTFTAVIILQLMEEKKLKLNDPIGLFLIDPKIDSIAMDTLNHYNGNSITIKELLTHTSGLCDYAQNPDFIQKIITEINYTWSPSAILDYYLRNHLNKYYNPVKNFRYSDMNYLLLGLIIEQITQKSLALNYTSRIFAKMNTKGTPYLKYYEPKPEKAEEQSFYWGTKNMESVNFSFEWGAGGLYMQAEDLHTFNESLFKKKLFRNKNTLKIMLQSLPTDAPKYLYMGTGLGIFHVKAEKKLEFYGHAGFFKTAICYIPRKKLFVTYALNQADANHIEFLKIILTGEKMKHHP